MLGIGIEKADGAGGKKIEVKICEELELPCIKTSVGISLFGLDWGGGDVGREVVTSRMPCAVGTSRRVITLGGGRLICAYAPPPWSI